MTESKTEEVTTPEETQVKAEEKPKRTFGRSAKPATTLAGLVDSDLVDPDTGAPAPLSATTENLQGVVVAHNGIPVLKISLRGWIGEEPVAVPASSAGEFAELIEALEKGVKAAKK